MQNPLTPLVNTARQLNEQVNLSARSLGDSLTQSANALLSAATQAAPPLPGTAAFNGLGLNGLLPNGLVQANNPGNRRRGNPNGNGRLFPTLQQLVPTDAIRAVSQVEDVLIPAGLPKPSRTLLQAFQPAPRVEEAPPEEPMVRRAPGIARTPGLEGPNGRSRATRAPGVQLV